MLNLSESRIKEDQDRKVDNYFKRYKKYFEALDTGSALSRVRSINESDYFALGHQLEAYEDYQRFCENTGQMAQLGTIPNIALDVVTASYASSPVAAIASVQPISEERGIVYYKDLVAATTRGNVTAGQRLVTPLAIEDVAMRGYATSMLTQSGGNTTTGTLTYTVTLAAAPVKPGTLSMTIAGSNNTAVAIIDNTSGTIYGVGVSGTVNYVTGVFTFTLASDPGTGNAIAVTYATDFGAATDLPDIQFKLESKPVNARVFALKSTMGLDMSYALNKRFGMIAEDEIANDLVVAMNAEISNTLIYNLSTVAVGNTNWSKTPPTGVSYFEHKQSFKDAVALATSVLVGNAGRGTINVMIAGLSACAIMQTLPGFTLVAGGNEVGPHIFGTLDGILIVRVPNSQTLGAFQVLCVYKGTTQFDSAAVYCPFMPLLVTSTLPTGTNPLLQQRAAAVWAAIENLVPNLVNMITITS
jgi:hypothetical protein